jgi:hypothetical protein
MNSVLNVAKSALKVLILWWVVANDKYKTALVSDPRHRIALVDFLQPWKPSTSGFQGWTKSTSAIRWIGSGTRAVFLLYTPSQELSMTHGNTFHMSISIILM